VREKLSDIIFKYYWQSILLELIIDEVLHLEFCRTKIIHKKISLYFADDAAHVH